MQFSATTIVLAMAYLAGIGAGAAIPQASSNQLVARDHHEHCACQVATNGEVDNVTTSLVLANNSWRWHQEQFPEQTSQGAHYEGYYYYYYCRLTSFLSRRGFPGASPLRHPPYEGYYLVANSGKINGDTFYNECRAVGAADSTCF
ncbi:hypothetical protein J3E74DRAFT_405551 [Bipolaris maydis]|nr:hypothetical protein J3E74DRAFT_413433 [Bipolaris maydis]KAJ5062301.1 hypothetical protein J3E74DRAFT_405551 [Bipolaris maydis]